MSILPKGCVAAVLEMVAAVAQLLLRMDLLTFGAMSRLRSRHKLDTYVLYIGARGKAKPLLSIITALPLVLQRPQQIHKYVSLKYIRHGAIPFQCASYVLSSSQRAPAAGSAQHLLINSAMVISRDVSDVPIC
jgi:hypothetical protein